MNGEPYSDDEQEQDVLKRSLSLRMPVFQGEDTTPFKIEQLENYMLLSAYVQGSLSAERERCRERLLGLDDRWEAIEHDAYYIGKNVTEKQVERDRRRDDPQLWMTRRELQRRVASLTEEILRMERDAKVCSRAYTFMTGAT